MKIPSGYSVITEGLSLKYNEVDKYTILDSAGLQTPLNKKNLLYYLFFKGNMETY